jgi:uncharacterized cupredoxin-like copper-binding protein
MHRASPRGGGSRAGSGPLSLPLGPPRLAGRLLTLSLAAAALALAAVGCGGGGSAATGTTQGTTTTARSAAAHSTTLHIQADPSGALRFDKPRLTARAGTVTIVMMNPSPLSHDIAIEGSGVDETGPVVSNGGTSTVTADLKPGTYTFLCTVDGHADAGMKGTLKVS